MYRSASVEQLKESDVYHPPKTPPPALRFKASPVRKKSLEKPNNRDSAVLDFPQERIRKRSGILSKHKDLDIFNMIENRDANSVAAMLRDPDVNINQVNEEGHTPLDVAIMVNSHEIGQLLLENGARENFKCKYSMPGPVK
jgi:ankyrin repeat protein